MLSLHTVFSAESVGETKLTRKTLGLLHTTGEIAAYDPLTESDAKSFTMRVPAGAWPVEVLLGERRGDTRVVLARVRFAETEPTRFELALVEGQDVRTLGANETFGYGVDAGVGCFAGDGSAGSEWILETLRKNDEMTWSYAVSEGLIAFSSGYGDGVYSSYVAYDAEGQLVSLTTNFSGFDLALPSHSPDAAFRQARATELFETLLLGLPRCNCDATRRILPRPTTSHSTSG